MTSLYPCMTFFFFFAVLNPVCLGAAGVNAAPVTSAGFSLALVPNHPHTADDLEELGANLTALRPRITHMPGPTYSVRVGVGSGDTQHFYRLAVDMVGNLTWMQCLPSNPKLKQDAPIFDPRTSHRYKNVGHDDPLCKAPFTPRPTEHRCGFNIRFRAEATATGYLGSDEFSFGAGSGGRTTSVDGLVFGCAHTINGWKNQDVLAGILSLNRRPTSFVRQLSTHGGGGGGGARFSYCLVDHLKYPNKHGFLRFGADVPDHSHAQSTALLHGEHDGGFGMYYVRLAGVSVAGKKLTGITPKMFQRDPRSRLGGCYVDVGNPATRFAEAPYDVLEAGVAAHLQSHGLHRTPVPGHRLCVRGTSPEVMPKLPSMTLHFAEDEAAGLEIKSRLLFATVKHGGADYVCFIVQRAPVTTVIGGHQQVDTRFTFDLEENRLFFAPEDCHGGMETQASLIGTPGYVQPMFDRVYVVDVKIKE